MQNYAVFCRGEFGQRLAGSMTNNDPQHSACKDAYMHPHHTGLIVFPGDNA